MKEKCKTYPIGKYIAVLFKYGANYITNRLKEFDDLDFQKGQMFILHVLSDKEGISQQDIKNYFMLDKGGVAKSVKTLVEKGYIKRIRNENDKRAYKLYLTEEGKKLKAFVKKTVAEWNNIVEIGINDNDKKALREILAKMEENANNYFNANMRK